MKIKKLPRLLRKEIKEELCHYLGFFMNLKYIKPTISRIITKTTTTPIIPIIPSFAMAPSPPNLIPFASTGLNM